MLAEHLSRPEADGVDDEVGVDVLGVDGNMAIVRTHDEGDTLNEGVRYWNPK